MLIGQVKRYFAYESRHQHGAIDMTSGFRHCLFSALFGEDEPILTHIFADGLVIQPPNPFGTGDDPRGLHPEVEPCSPPKSFGEAEMLFTQETSKTSSRKTDA